MMTSVVISVETIPNDCVLSGNRLEWRKLSIVIEAKRSSRVYYVSSVSGIGELYSLTSVEY